jgi:hypothetical protein
MANGLVVTDTAISVGGRSALGANLGRYEIYRVTHTSDTALATHAAGGSAFGSSFTAVVPTDGFARVSLITFELDETEGNAANIAVGLKIASDSILWPHTDGQDGGVGMAYQTRIDASVSSQLIGSGVGIHNNGQVRAYATYDVTASTAGSQTLQLYAADNLPGDANTGEITITGTSTTAVCLVEVIDGS